MPSMPEVVGLDSWAALQAMVTAGGRVLPLSIFQDDPVLIRFQEGAGKPGFVISQTPASGTNIAANSPVTLTCFAFPMAVAYPAGDTNV